MTDEDIGITYYLWSRGRIRPSEVYKMRKDKSKKGEYIMLKAFYLMEMEEEKAKTELQIKLAQASLLG